MPYSRKWLSKGDTCGTNYSYFKSLHQLIFTLLNLTTYNIPLVLLLILKLELDKTCSLQKGEPFGTNYF